MRKSIKALLLVVLALTLVFSLVACGEHKHTYSNEWTTTETHHWQAATCDHDVKWNEGSHQFGASTQNGNNLEYTCRTCGYVKSEPIPPHECSYGPWITRTQATMLAEGEEYRRCTCGEEITQVIPKVEVASLTVANQPNKTSYLAGETFDATGIVVNATGVDGSTAGVTEYVTYDKTTLSAGDTVVTVTFGGKTTTVAVSVHSHKYPDAWTVRTPATLTSEGLEYRACSC